MLVAETLAAAFVDDPAFTALFPDRRDAALGDWFTVVVEVLGSCDLGEIALRGPAVGIWTTGSCEPCGAALDDRLVEVIQRHCGAAGLATAAALSQAADSPEADAWFLHWIGTPPAERRAGHGRRLLSRILLDADDAGAPLWTTTTNPAAVALYTGAGMSVRAERAVAGRPGLTCWTLVSTRS